MSNPQKRKPRVEYTVADRHRNAHGESNVARIVRPPLRLRRTDVDFLRRFASEALSEKVYGFAICAVGTDFATWYGHRALTRQDRMTLLGQLQMLIADITKEEEESR